MASREHEILIGALAKPHAAERAAFLDQACAGDLTLRQRLEELLRDAAAKEAALEGAASAGEEMPPTKVASGPRGTELVAPLTEKAGDRIGRYRLLQQIGEGGCGVVYMADQEEPVRRRVAVKVIKLGMDTRSVIARFEAERQALAMMDHPNIARVLDAGATETGRPYFVMELVRGVRITEYCDSNKSSLAERLTLFNQVCQAVQHAHQKGIIHRDLKPSNILVTLHDGVPVPKVIDFGIAKATEQRLTEKTLFTEFSAFIGTPAYMSPEQAAMSGLDVDTRSDLYSLGVLLYELLTGKTPFDPEALYRAGLEECRRTIREQEPARPSTCLSTMTGPDLTTTAERRRTEAPRLITSLQGDLDWIVMKCLEKDRTRRYDTANALMLDLERYLASEPVLARPPSNLYRLQKFLRRHRLVVGAATGIAATLIVGAAVSTWQAVRATKAEAVAYQAQALEAVLRQQAENEKASARLNEYIADMNLAQQSIAAGNYGRAAQLVEKHRPKPGEPDLRGFEWRYLWRLCRGDEHAALPNQDGTILAIAVSPDGRLAAVGLREHVKIWDLRMRNLVASLPKGGLSLAFLPDGKTLVTATRGGVRVWRTTNWTELSPLPEASGPVALSADGRLLATQGAAGVRVWDTATWRETRTLAGASGPMAFSPDQTTLAADSRDGITLWPLDPGRTPVTLEDSESLFMRAGPWFRTDRGMAFTPDGRSLIAMRNSSSPRGVFVISVWDTTTGKETAVLPDDPERAEHTGVISELVLSPDGGTVATASWDHSIRLWDLRSRRLLRALQGHVNEVWAVGFSPDGQTVLSGAKDGGLHLWPTQPPPTEDFLPSGWTPAAFSGDGRRVAALNPPGKVTIFALATREAEQQLTLVSSRPSFRESQPPARGDRPSEPGGGAPPPGMTGEPPGGGRESRPFSMPVCAFSRDLRLLAHGRNDGLVQIWDTETHESNLLRVSGGPVDSVALDPDGQRLVAGSRGQTLRWWNLREGTNAVLTLEGQRAIFSPDGRLLAVIQRNNTAQIWDVARQALQTNFVIDPAPGFSAVFSPDGRILATTAGIDDLDNGIRLWSTDTGQLVGACIGHKQLVWAVALAPDGRTLASSSDDGTVKLWNLATQQELLSVRRPGQAPRHLVFSPDGRVLVGTDSFQSRGSGTRIFRAPLLTETETPGGRR